MALLTICAGLLGWMQAPIQAVAGDLPSPPMVSRVSSVPHTMWLVDPLGKLSIEEISSPAFDSQFTPLQGPLSLGFTRSVAWIRLDLSQVEPAQWLLDVGNPLLEDVRLYERSTQGAWQVRHGTLSDHGAQRDMNYRNPVFKLNLVTGNHSVFYVRLSSRTALVTNLQLATPESLFEKDTREAFVWGLVFGAYFLVMLFYFAFWAWTRERVHLYYVLYVATNFGAALMTGRWLDMLGLRIDTQTHTLVLGLLISLSLWIGPIFTVSFLGTHKIWPRLSRMVLRMCATVSLLGIALVVMGFYSQGVMSVQLTSMLVILITLVASGHMARQGDRRGQMLLLAFSLFYVGVVWRYMRNIGLIEPTAWNESVYQVGAFVHMMVMSTAIFSSYNSLRRKSEQEKARANAEQRQRQRQFEFLGMVSHEVRTPLTVISASADNLLMDHQLSPASKARVDKIISHSEKIQSLFDAYLNDARLLNGDMPIAMTHVDLVALCESIVKDMQETHGTAVHFEKSLVPSLVCNGDLIKVAVSNLLDNARKHAAFQSRIALTLQHTPESVLISVKDQGPGVEDSELPFIFDAFYRGKSTQKSKGSGLGLHLVKFIAEQHRGHVKAIKAPAQGMEFVIELPTGPTHSSV